MNIDVGTLVKLNPRMGSKIKLFKTSIEDTSCQTVLETITIDDIAVVIETTQASTRVMTATGAVGWSHSVFFMKV